MAEAAFTLDPSFVEEGQTEEPLNDLATLMMGLDAASQSQNLAADLPDDRLTEIGQIVVDEFEIDKRSREKWEQAAKKTMDLALQVAEAKNYPWPNASNVKYPLITVAALQFNARAYPAIINDGSIVKAGVVGNDEGVPAIDPNTGQPVVDPQTGEQAFEVPPGFKRQKADRIAAHMSWQLLDKMEEWEEDTDTLLMQIPITGCAFRKVWQDPKAGRCRSEMVSALNLVVNNKAKSLRDAQRITQCCEVYPGDFEENVRAGIWRRIELGNVQDGDGDEDAPHDFLEQHRRIDLDGDGYAEPYIVTVHKESREVVRIVANYRVQDVKLNIASQEIVKIPARDYYVKYAFLPDPEGGFYDIGFGRLLEGLSGAIDTTINQIDRKSVV